MKNDFTITSDNRKKKEVIVAEVTAKVQKAKGMVFTNYEGLTHQQLETIKRGVKKVDAEYVAAKNTLFLRSLAENNLSDEAKKQFEKPTATLFMYGDVVEPLKLLSKTIKELKLPVIKFGLLDGKEISDIDVTKLASLPSIDVLRAQLLGQMMSPIQGLHRALNWNMQKFVMTLNAIASKKA
ncbi:hypothetical protein BH11PAT1_BH11PAT1_1930 [soil metagenome]